MSFQFKASMTCAMSSIFFACATPALADAGRVVVTAPSDDERSTRLVRYADLNLAVPRDMKRLDSRVNAAIKDVCGLSDYLRTGQSRLGRRITRAARKRGPRLARRWGRRLLWHRDRAPVGSKLRLRRSLSRRAPATERVLSCRASSQLKEASLEHLLIDELETNARLLETNAALWEQRAARVSKPSVRSLLRRRAVRGRKLAARLREEASSEACSRSQTDPERAI